MTPLARLLERRARGGQGGYLLIYVLGVIGLTSVLVIALLGLAMTSAKVAAMEAQMSREARAADGALEAQIAQIASRGGDVCDSATPRTVIGNEGAGGASPSVEVECTTSGVAVNPEATLDGPDVEIVGTSPYASDGVAPAASDPSLAGANLVVRGSSAPARFDADVLIAGGADADRSSGSPALEVAGQYVQGATVGGSGCGVLATDGSSHRITDGGGAGEPTCGTAPSITPAVPYDPTALTRPLAGRDFDCSSGTVHLAPGSYDNNDFTFLNALLSGTAACTVVFDPGAHYLDVYDTSRPAATRSVLTISNPNVRVIGGVPSSDPFPRACDTGAGGVQLVLSPRSAIRHTAGEVALCPALGAGGALPVVALARATSTQPVLTGTPAPTTFGNVAALGGTTGWATGALCILRWSWQYWSFVTECSPQTFTTTWSSAGAGPLRSARVLLEMQEWPDIVGPDDPASYHSTDVRVTFAVSGTVSCTTAALPAGRTYGRTLSYDLMGSGTCATTLNQQEQLNGATVTATFSVQGAGSQGLVLNARNIRIETNSATLVGSAAVDNSGWTDPTNARTLDGAVARVAQPPHPFMPVTVWETASHVTRSFALNGFSLASSGLRSSDTVDRLSVLVNGPVTELSFLSHPGDGGSTTLTLTTADGQQCRTSTTGYVQSNAAVRYDLIGDGGNCAPVVRSAAQLEGAKVDFSVTSGCTQPWFPNPGDLSQCSSVALPKVDSISLVAGSDSYTGRPPSWSVSVDTSNHTSFDAFGPVDLPTADLQVRWVGPSYPRPLFAGRLQVNGLGVDQLGPTQGSVCCVVNESGAVLVARVNGEVRAQATLRVDAGRVGTPSARRPVDILSWKLCARSGC